MKKVFLFAALLFASFAANGQMVAMRTFNKETATVTTNEETKFLLNLIPNETGDSDGILWVVTADGTRKEFAVKLAEGFAYPTNVKFSANGVEWVWKLDGEPAIISNGIVWK